MSQKKGLTHLEKRMTTVDIRISVSMHLPSSQVQKPTAPNHRCKEIGRNGKEILPLQKSPA
jgi:hypothetical protein